MAEPYPWETAHPLVIKAMNLRMNEITRKKLEYVADYTRGPITHHKLVLQILEQGLNDRLRAMGVKVE